MLLPGKTGFLRGQGSKRIRCRKRRCTGVRRFFCCRAAGPPQHFPAGAGRRTVPGRTGGQGGRAGRTNVFCATDISAPAAARMDGNFAGMEFCVQPFTAKTRNVYKFIAKFDVPPMMHPSFLCKMAKYTCCTVFRAKFIHFSKDVNSHAKTRAIFVRFLFGYLQFASFFLFVVLLS